MSSLSKKFPCESKRILKWAGLVLSAAAVGLLCGAIGGGFARSIAFVTALRSEYPWIIYLLPIGGLVSAGIYKLAKTEGIGTNTVIEAAKGESETPVLLIPAVFTASVITHLFGGSAGKEGAALQIEGGIASLVSKVIKADVKTRSLLTLCGMAALFSAAFGTPVGACVFVFELAFSGKLSLNNNSHKDNSCFLF
ncbi:MAG: chloride channel protein [Clostridia bacterium]|nr:chloride channel protein [Clostridia bacterium]